MERKIPILLSFYGLSNGTTTLLSGHLAYSKLEDLSFKDYSRRRTFRTLVSLYRTKPYANQTLTLVFDKERVNVTTDHYGAVYARVPADLSACHLQKATMANGEDVRLVTELYGQQVQNVTADVIVVSDIDDTLLHSYILRKFIKLRTLMFTTVEKRKTVTTMQELLRQFTGKGAIPFYLSNSEQNLYPLIYRFLMHNHFPPGPLFLKKMRRLWHVLWNIKFPLKNLHKQQTLDEIFTMFPGKKFILMGDNTQQDLTIYLEAAQRFPASIRHIIIREVNLKKSDAVLIQKHSKTLMEHGIGLHYGDTFSQTFRF